MQQLHVAQRWRDAVVRRCGKDCRAFRCRRLQDGHPLQQYVRAIGTAGRVVGFEQERKERMLIDTYFPGVSKTIDTKLSQVNTV